MDALLKTSSEIASFICELFQKQPLTLFAGAGVGVEAGLPDWKTYLDDLIAFVKDYEPQSADLMRLRVSGGYYPEAAHIFKTCLAIPDSSKAKKLAEPFKKYDSIKLRSLARLPFTSVITTNYDSSMHDAWAAVNKKAPPSFESDTASLRAAVFASDFFISRIHGRAEMPETIILETDDYKKLIQNEGYIDFLKHAFLHQTCLFIGFSFVDPAIRGILQVAREKFGAYPKTHYALLPIGAQQLREELARMNVEVRFYEPDSGHAALWKGVESASLQCGGKAPEGERRPDRVPSETAKQLISLCYAQYKIQSHVMPLKTLVVQGIILAIVEEGFDEFNEIANKLRALLPLADAEAKSLLSEILPELIQKGGLTNRDGIKISEATPTRDGSPIQNLADSFEARILVRSKYQIRANERLALSKILEDVVVSRGWQL